MATNSRFLLTVFILMVMIPQGLFAMDRSFVGPNLNPHDIKGISAGAQKRRSMLFGCPGLEGDANITCKHEKLESKLGQGIDCTENVPVYTKAFFLNCQTGYGLVEEYQIITCKFPGKWDNDMFTCEEKPIEATTTLKATNKTTNITTTKKPTTTTKLTTKHTTSLTSNSTTSRTMAGITVYPANTATTSNNLSTTTTPANVATAAITPPITTTTSAAVAMINTQLTTGASTITADSTVATTTTTPAITTTVPTTTTPATTTTVPTTTTPTTTTTVATTTTTSPAVTPTVVTTTPVTTTVATITTTAVAITTTTSASVPTPPPYQHVANVGMIKRGTKPKTLNGAQADCNADGARILVVDNDSKREFMKNFTDNPDVFEGATISVDVWSGVAWNGYLQYWYNLYGTWVKHTPAFKWGDGRPVSGTTHAVYNKDTQTHYDVFLTELVSRIHPYVCVKV